LQPRPCRLSDSKQATRKGNEEKANKKHFTK